MPWQTPSLYAYINDGVFSDADFKALINVGSGSKADNVGAIGRHGLGSLTMYRFTDIPSLISGKYFIIFDPSRQYLPLGTNHRLRRAGLKISLDQMRSSFKHHLEPFVGIGGYSLGIGFLSGY
jgi:sacsin